MRFVGWFALVLLGTSSILGCGGPLLEGRGHAGSVAIVDLDEVARRLGREEELAQRVAERELAYNQQLAQLQGRMREQLNARAAELGDMPSEPQKQELKEIGQRLSNELLLARNKAQAEVRQFKRELLDQLREEFKPVARAVAAERGLTIVMTRNESVVFDVAPECDVTEAVIARLSGSAAQR